MNDKKRKTLENAGYKVGGIGDFLNLSKEELALVELRAAVSAIVQAKRQKLKLTQVRVAKMMQSSQSRIAKIERGSNDVSLDLMFRGLFTVGGGYSDVLKLLKMRHARSSNVRKRIVAKSH